MEDLISIGTIGLIKAIESYRPKKGTKLDKEGNEITLIDILGSEADDVIKEVDLKIEKSKIYRNLDI